MVAFVLIAASVCELDVVPCEWVAASADWDDFVDFGAHWVWCLQCLVDWFAADGAHIVCCEDSCSELCAFPAVGFSWVWLVLSAHLIRDVDAELLECAQVIGLVDAESPCGEGVFAVELHGGLLALVRDAFELVSNLLKYVFHCCSFASDWLVPSAGVEPAHTYGRKEEDPKICDRCDLPLIPTKAWTGGLSFTASRVAGLACLPLLVYAPL